MRCRSRPWVALFATLLAGIVDVPASSQATYPFESVLTWEGDPLAPGSDRDGDRIADPLDLFPDAAERATATTRLEARLSVPPHGFMSGSLQARVHLFEDLGFLLCPQVTPEPPCISGFWRPTLGRRLEVVWPEEAVAAFEAGVEQDLEQGLSRLEGRPVDLALLFPRDRVRLRAAVSGNGRRLRLRFEFPYVATTDDPDAETLHGAFRIRADTETLAR